MNDELTFEAEAFELAAPAPHHPCGCAKCQSRRGQENPEQEGVSDELTFEEEFLEIPLYGSTHAGGITGRQIESTWIGLTAEKTCWIQNVLNRAAGESLVVDGIYGPLTRAAAVRFQSNQSLLVDGVVGPQTETALIQIALNTIALASLLPVNGVRDARTMQEIRKFQSQNRLVVDGIVGPITRGAMIAALGGRRCRPRATRPPVPLPVSPPLPPIGPPPPPPAPTCNQPEFSRRIDACDAKRSRCLDLAAKTRPLRLRGIAVAICGHASARCTAAAKAATNCQ